MSKKGLGKFVAGAAVGAGLGILFAPKDDEHIQMLSKLAELLGDPSFVEGLDTVTSKEEFIALLTKYEGNEQHDA